MLKYYLIHKSRLWCFFDAKHTNLLQTLTSGLYWTSAHCQEQQKMYYISALERNIFFMISFASAEEKDISADGRVSEALWVGTGSGLLQDWSQVWQSGPAQATNPWQWGCKYTGLHVYASHTPTNREGGREGGGRGEGGGRELRGSQC